MSVSLNDLDSRFRPIAEQLIAKCAADGCKVRIITTGRTLAEQEKAVAHGVSWTMHSKHLPQPPEGKSLAIDLCPEVYLALKGWNPAGPLWWTIAEIAVSLGLRSGMDWDRVGLPTVGKTRPCWDPGHAQYESGAEAPLPFIEPIVPAST